MNRLSAPCADLGKRG